MKPRPARVSVGAYARHLGVSHTAIQIAMRNGRLRRSVGRDARGPFVSNVALADREWKAGQSKPANGGGGKPRPVRPAAPAEPAALGTLVEAQTRVDSGRAVD